MKNKKIITFLAIGAIILIGGGIFILSSNKKPAPVIEQVPQEEQITIMKPEEIGLSLTTSIDKKKIILEVANTKDITGLDYELSYTSKGDIPRGVIGHISVPQAGKSVRQEITLGTCSDVCHYDQDVSNIKLILKVTKIDGTTSQVSKSLSL